MIRAGRGIGSTTDQKVRKTPAANPEAAPFLEQADYAVAVPNQEGVSDVVADLNSQLESLSSSDPQTILESAQTNLEAALGAS